MFRGRRADDPESNDWWAAPVDGGEPIRAQAVENLSLTAIVHYPVGWAGNNIYFVSGTTIEGVNLFLVFIDLKSLTIRGPAETIATGPGTKVFPAAMPDSRIVYANMTAVITVRSLAARADEAVVSGIPGRLTQDLMQKFAPLISRDGSRAAFVAFGGIQGSRIELRSKDLKTGQETAIPMQEVYLGGTVLSPDGTHLAYRDFGDGKMRTCILAPGASTGPEVCAGCYVLGFFSGNNFALVRVKRNVLLKMSPKSGTTVFLLSSGGKTILDAELVPDEK